MARIRSMCSRMLIADSGPHIARKAIRCLSPPAGASVAGADLHPAVPPRSTLLAEKVGACRSRREGLLRVARDGDTFTADTVDARRAIFHNYCNSTNIIPGLIGHSN